MSSLEGDADRQVYHPAIQERLDRGEITAADLEASRLRASALDAIIPTASAIEVRKLGCPECGGPITITYVRLLLIIGPSAIWIKCNKGCYRSVADGRYPRPPWAKKLGNEIVTEPK
jgi:hypothetical protein